MCLKKEGRGEKTLAIKLEFTIRSEMRSRSGRGAKLFKTNVYLEKWALSMGLPVLPECRTNVFTGPGQSRPPAALHADPCIIEWPLSEDNIPQKDTKYGQGWNGPLLWINCLAVEIRVIQHELSEENISHLAFCKVDAILIFHAHFKKKIKKACVLL